MSGNEPGYKLPPFWTDDPCRWFEKVKSTFKALNVKSEKTKFTMVILALDESILTR